MSQDTLKLFQWMSEHLQEVQNYNNKFISKDNVDDFHSWYIYETNLKKLCSKINPKISVLIGNFTNEIIFEKPTNEKLGRLINELLQQGFLFSILNDDEPNVVKIDIDYGMLMEAK